MISIYHGEHINKSPIFIFIRDLFIYKLDDYFSDQMHLDSIQSSWHYFMEMHNCGHTKKLEEVNKIGNQGKHQRWLKGRRQYSLILLTLFGEKM